MVRVPEYTPYPTVQASDTPTRSMRVEVNPDMFGANIGRAMTDWLVRASKSFPTPSPTSKICRTRRLSRNR